VYLFISRADRFWSDLPNINSSINAPNSNFFVILHVTPHSAIKSILIPIVVPWESRFDSLGCSKHFISLMLAVLSKSQFQFDEAQFTSSCTAY
jgi:hypothetical protein